MHDYTFVYHNKMNPTEYNPSPEAYSRSESQGIFHFFGTSKFITGFALASYRPCSESD